jgi:uncharacterized protein YidB (DUF937 family)
MGLLDSMLGGMLGGGQAQPSGGDAAGMLMQVVAAMLAHQGPGGGGLGGLAGLPIAPDQLGGVLGGDLLSQITRHTGMNQGDVLGQLSQLLPQMVDRATPEGHIPEAGLGDIGAILGRFTNPR